MAEETTTSLDAALGGTESQEQLDMQAQPVETVEEKPEPKGSDDGQIKVPLAALHEVRDANRALKQQLDALQANQTRPQEPENVPDPIDDPSGYNAYVQKAIASAVNDAGASFNDRLLNMSEAYATRAHGVEAVEAAKEWALAQPDSVKAEIVSQADPYEYAVQQHQRHTLTQQIADPKVLAEFQRFLADKGQPGRAKPIPPTNTAVDQSVGARQAQWAGPTSLDDIFTN